MTFKSLLVFAFPVFLAASLLAGCASTPKPAPTAAADAAEPLTGSSATLIVHGMSCPLCANNVDDLLMAVPGVKSVNVDMGTGEVKVALAQGARVTREQLAKAVDDSGFTLAELRTP